MNNEMYLIHGEDYIKHIDDKVLLYAMVKQLCHRVAKLPSNRGNKSLSDLAKSYNVLAEKKFRSWGIPASYLYTHDPDELALLVSNELIEPEEAGYYACDGECCCADCDFCCQTEGYDEEEIEEYDEADDNDGFAHFFGEISSFLHSVFGDNATVHIILE